MADLDPRGHCVRGTVLQELGRGPVRAPVSPRCLSKLLWARNPQNLQSAIDAATEGDIVVAEPGTYLENINFIGKGITLRSEDPDDPAVAATIIDGGQKGSVVSFKVEALP